MSADCIFCKIVAGQIPASKVYEDEHVLAFDDLHPVAPVHLLVIPKRHVASVNELTAEHAAMVGQLFVVARKVAELKGIADSGYRVSTNTGKDSGQAVFHLHFHVIGGKGLGRMG